MKAPIIEFPDTGVSWLEDGITSRHLAGFGIGFLVFLFVIPVALLLWESLNFGGGNPFEHYRQALSGVYVSTLLRTFYYALLTTIVCLVLAYVFCYYVVFKSERKLFLMALVAVPLWVAIIIRYFGVALFFLPTGPVAKLFGTDFGILFDTPGVIVGLTCALLPLAIFPIYNSLQSIDEEMIHASRVLGASQIHTVREVILPMSLSGIVAATLFVYILAAGSYLAPAILGGSGDFLMANIIERSFGYNTELAAALAVVFTVSLLIIVGTFNRYVNIAEVLGDL